MRFFKGVLISHLKNEYVPGTVTTDFKIAFEWYERISGKKRTGAARHVTHGRSCIIEITYTDMLLDHNEFQRKDIAEHERRNCWTSVAKNKAQINTVCNYRVLSDSEIDALFTI